jgi:hypothetical protein
MQAHSCRYLHLFYDRCTKCRFRHTVCLVCGSAHRIDVQWLRNFNLATWFNHPAMSVVLLRLSEAEKSTRLETKPPSSPWTGQGLDIRLGHSGGKWSLVVRSGVDISCHPTTSHSLVQLWTGSSKYLHSITFCPSVQLCQNSASRLIRRLPIERCIRKFPKVKHLTQ